MTALGINISERDQVKGWESNEPRKLSKLEIAFLDAKEEEDTALAKYVQACDQLEYAKTNYPEDTSSIEAFQSTVDERWDDLKVAEQRTHRCYIQKCCPHIHVSYSGGFGLSGGEVWENIVRACEDCGAEVE